MSDDQYLDLDAFTEFRQTIEGGAPPIVHLTAILLIGLLATAVSWALFTEADLVVRATGRVRSVTPPQKVFATVQAGVPGVVAEVNAKEGQEVRAGDLLLRLETEQLDHDIAKCRRAIETGERELSKLEQVGLLLQRRLASAKAKLEAQRSRAQEELNRATRERAARIRLAELALRSATEDVARLQKLVEGKAAAPVELSEATHRMQAAQEALTEARLPVVRNRIEFWEESAELLEREHALKLAEHGVLGTRRRGEVEAARAELAHLESLRAQAVLSAPIAGVIIDGSPKVGDIIELGHPVFEIAPPGRFRFELAVPSSEVGRLRPDMEARVKLDAYDYQRYGCLRGRICFIAPDSTVVGDTNGPLAAVYVVRLELETEELVRGNLRGPIKLGMTGHAEIVNGRETILALLFRKVRQSISLG